MTSKPTPTDLVGERIRQLGDYRRRVLHLPGDQALAAIVDHPQPSALVHSFPEEDLHCLVHDIGLDNALPLLALASTRQWEYMMDMEVWRRDRLDYPQTTTWLQLLLHADPGRLVRWCLADRLEFLELYLFRNIEVRSREAEESPSDFGEGYFTDDDTYYVRFIDYPATTPQEQATKDQRNQLLGQLLRRLSLTDHHRYQGLLLEAAATIPAEAEEALFRLRNVRLAEKGFLPFHEAVGVYQPLRPGDIATRRPKRRLPSSPADAHIPVPQFAAAFLDGDNLFVRALKGIHDVFAIQQLQMELAGLCNQVVAADQILIKGREPLRRVVAKVSGYLSIGLEQMTDAAAPNREGRASLLLQRHLLADIFRTGLSGALQLKWDASRWRQTSWFHAQGLDLTFWDEAFMGLLGGLLIERPKFYDPGHEGSNYREFLTMEEINRTQRELNRIMALDRLFQGMTVAVPPPSGKRLLTYKNLLLTLWARAAIQLPPIDAATSDPAIPLAAFRRWQSALWTEGQARRFIDDDVKSMFLQWAAEASGIALSDLSDRLGETFAALFDDLERELAQVKPANLDPRYVHLFMLTS